MTEEAATYTARRAPAEAAVAWVRSLDRVAWIVIGLTVLAVVTRLVGLSARAVHHDEALHLQYSWYFAEGRGYQHNPLMHGPLQFHLIAAFFTLFGDSEFVGRLPHALAGIALVATPLLFRRHLGGVAVVLASLFLLVSPSLLYYSRFARNEPFVALATVLMLLAILRYREGGRLRWLAVFTAALAVQFAAKETAYIVAALALLYLNFATAHELFWAPRRERGERPPWRVQALHGAWLVPSAWAIVTAWPLLRGLRARFAWRERPRDADLLVLTGTLTLPLLAAFLPHARGFLHRLPLGVGAVMDVVVDFILSPPLFALVDGATSVFGGSLTDEERTGAAVVIALLAASAVVGLAWRRREWLICFAVFTAVLVPLYTAWGTNMPGVAGIYWTSLDYWIEQQEVQRANQPWFYYFMLTPLYEMLVLVPGLIGGLWLTLRRRDPVAAMFLWWFLGMFAALSYAGEKMPWLTVHLALPLVFLAAHALGGALPRAFEAARAGRGSSWQWSAGGVSLAGLVAMSALTLWTNYGLNVDHPDTPIEPFMYAQTTHTTRLLADAVIEEVEAGRATGVLIDNQANLTWPWAWYLRHQPVLYQDGKDMDAGTLEGAPVVIGTPGILRALRASDGWRRVEYTHYEWPHDSGYRNVTWGSLGRGIANASLVDDWWQFLLQRDPRSPLLYRNGEVLFPPSAEVDPRGFEPPR
ncbi:MAG: TIGR03663 family protein [Dehalococcoidia bacterium]|nr:TIGR03663 family protein [Dehalococcoidia bacterium]